MQDLKKYCFFILLFFTASISAYTQDVNVWKIDSVSAIKSNVPHWSVDSARYAPVKEEVLLSEVLIPSPNWKRYISEHNQFVNFTTTGGGIVSDGDFAPFWLTNNQQGIGSAENTKAYLRLNAFGYKNTGEINISGGVDVLASGNYDSDFYIQQLFADVTYQKVRLSVGAKERQSLFKNKTLSSGGLTLSNNARPIPQVEFSIPDFISIPYTNNQLQIMGGLSYGWFADTRFKHKNAADGYYADNVLYHRKYGFLKYIPNKVWSFVVGLEMDTQWGGRFYREGANWYSGSAKLKDFFKVLIPMSGGSESNITDRQNIVGNVYGSMHFMGSYKGDYYSLKAYHEHFFEDHSGLIFKNIPDGLYGIEVNLKKFDWISSVVFEYLHTKNQSGPFLWDKNEEIPVQVSGGDNYYNHIDYISLTNYGYVLGNPFFTSPIYNRKQSLTVYNTRLSSFHLGVGGNVSKRIAYRALASYSKSWGTPLIPSTDIRKQFSGLLEAIYNNPAGWLLSGAVAFDNSDMVGDNVGFQLKVSKTFRIR